MINYKPVPKTVVFEIPQEWNWWMG